MKVWWGAGRGRRRRMGGGEWGDEDDFMGEEIDVGITSL